MMLRTTHLTWCKSQWLQHWWNEMMQLWYFHTTSKTLHKITSHVNHLITLARSSAALEKGLQCLTIISYHTWQFNHLHYHRLHLILLAQYFILNSTLGSSANPFLHRPFPFLLDWLHELSDHLTILLCSAAGFVCIVC